MADQDSHKQPKKLLAFAGSLRAGSFNKQLIACVVKEAEKAGAEVTLLDLNDFPLPIYNGDIEEEGMPAKVRELQGILARHDGLLISTPEYNGAVPALVKNTLDWLTREQANGNSGIELFKGKVVGIVSASPGALGGLRSLVLLRDQLAKLSMWVAPAQFALGKAHEAFDENGALKDEGHVKQISGVVQQVIDF
ncbi:hypothetical protein CWE13_11135 [Aliidiomarina shirensis]|uniref:NADPH-dependent FMN reductase-like domain-containing protein n=1 Tax=Aliidiomarina shirensis TaxID=1048642 RepID=A0A432WNV7_9GAMM|nr:NAD(P)H-dependent oxidoreductase [Aliidiomarina shirensis]RUO35476.1 hypothetical protein CWE13_11135 [Aliidiomarina shirensis]